MGFWLIGDSRYLQNMSLVKSWCDWLRLWAVCHLRFLNAVKKKKKKRRNLKMLFGNFVFSLKYISWQCSKALIGDIVNYCVKQCQYELTDNSLCTEDRNSSHSNVTSLHPRFKVRLSTLGYSFFLFCDRGRHFDCIMVYVCLIIFLLFSTANSLWCAVFVLGLLIYFVQSRKINK